MANAPANSFLVEFYRQNELLLSTNVEYFNEYVAALKATNYVKIKGNTYSVKELILNHAERGDNLTIELIVNLK